MENNKVENIILNLIQGIDPRTGKLISSESPILQEDVKSALNLALDAIRATYIKKLTLPMNTGKTWTKEEDDKLEKEFEKGISIEKLARTFLRTRGSIQARLIKLGKIEDCGQFNYK